MAKNHIEKFKEERERRNRQVFKYAGTSIKRSFNLDRQVYGAGALPRKTKELMGLVASLALRCDDCILYHIIRCYEEDVTDKELEEALAIGLVVGGSITIPHMRRAFQAWDELKEERKPSAQKRG